MTDLLGNGVLIQSGQPIFGALVTLVGIKGDLDLHDNYMNLARSYSRVGSKSKIEGCLVLRNRSQVEYNGWWK